jgi:hypothetical protein
MVRRYLRVLDALRLVGAVALVHGLQRPARRPQGSRDDERAEAAVEEEAQPGRRRLPGHRSRSLADRFDFRDRQAIVAGHVPGRLVRARRTYERVMTDSNLV